MNTFEGRQRKVCVTAARLRDGFLFHDVTPRRTDPDHGVITTILTPPLSTQATVSITAQLSYLLLLNVTPAFTAPDHGGVARVLTLPLGTLAWRFYFATLLGDRFFFYVTSVVAGADHGGVT